MADPAPNGTPALPGAPVVVAELVLMPDGTVRLAGGLGNPKQTALALLSIAAGIMQRDMVDAPPQLVIAPPSLVTPGS